MRSLDMGSAGPKAPTNWKMLKYTQLGSSSATYCARSASVACGLTPCASIKVIKGEKSQQIQKIATIHEKAQRVVVWLGPTDTDREVAMKPCRSYTLLGRYQSAARSPDVLMTERYKIWDSP